MSSAHRMRVQFSQGLPQAMTVAGNVITFNTKFVAVVKTAYTNGNMQNRPIGEIVDSVDLALRGQQSRIVAWNRDAIVQALGYLADKGSIKLPVEDPALV